MNPAIVIPSYWAADDRPRSIGEVGSYDHATPVGKPMPELETCLESLEKVRGVLRVIVLLVAEPECEESARARVTAICRTHPNLSPVIVGEPEAQHIEDTVNAIAPDVEGDPVALRGYGAIRNMGLAVAAVLGHDIVVFLDDDEVALDENFLIDAVYGLGNVNRQDIAIDAKSGFFIDRADSCFADEEHPRWSDRFWAKRSEFNQWMRAAQQATRISRSNYVCGGCFAVHANAFTQVGFDPYITRGEDMDYLINMRMHGHEVWFDNQWYVRHLPPEIPSHASRFLQDVYRWTYEYEKVRFTNTQHDLRVITRQSLEPYPAPWLSREVFDRIRKTSFRRALAEPEHLAYLRIWLKGRKDAQRWAKDHAKTYLEFQTFWPRIMASLWDDENLAEKVLATGTPASRKDRQDGRTEH